MARDFIALLPGERRAHAHRRHFEALERVQGHGRWRIAGAFAGGVTSSANAVGADNNSRTASADLNMIDIFGFPEDECGDPARPHAVIGADHLAANVACDLAARKRTSGPGIGDEEPLSGSASPRTANVGAAEEFGGSAPTRRWRRVERRTQLVAS